MVYQRSISSLLNWVAHVLKELVHVFEHSFGCVRWNHICLHLSAAHAVQHRFDVLRYVGNGHRTRTYILQEQVIELVHEAARSKLYVPEVKLYRSFRNKL